MGKTAMGWQRGGADDGDIVIQSCNEGLGCGVSEAGFVLLFSEALLCECNLADMSVVCSVGLEVEGLGFK
jgi:hypothetical protein